MNETTGTEPPETLAPLTSPPDAKRLIGAAIAAVLSVLGVLFIDAKVEFHAVEQHLLWAGNKFKLDNFFSATEPIGGYVALVVTFWAICALAPQRRAYLGGLLMALIISGLTVGIMKEGFGRARPDYSIIVDEGQQRDKKREMMAIADQHPHLEFERDPQGGVINQSIWLLWDRPFSLIGQNQFTSYPSGHANQAFVLAVFLTAFFKGRGRNLWYLLAIGCALSRVRYERHFPTDLLMGGAIGYVVTHWVLSWQWPTRFGARLFRAQPLETWEPPDPGHSS